uniref:Granulins domain-containing protein n=1 Tax=Meloidogyne incognita TaxID=6306 RepID=A0A914MC22_MELIC
MKSLYLIFVLFCFVKADEEVICPDFRSKCPGGTTCCTLDSGDFGCCPLPKAVCCSDHVHCCPENNKCDVERQLCLHTNEGGIITSQPLRRKVPSTKMYEVICPDGKHSCPAHHTCCPIGSKKQFWKNYGCCPAEKAVCCSDHLHCCPHGTECDISEARCLIPPFLREIETRKLPPFSIQHKKDVPSERKIKAESMEPAVRLCGLQFIDAITGSVRAQKFCPVTTKCCSYPYYDDEIGTIYERELGCCPFKDGNCCRYSRKCCPKGFECTKDNKCISIENYESQEEKEVVEPISTTEHYEVSYPTLFPSLPSCPDRSKCVPRGGITSRGDTTTCCPRYDNNKLIVGYDCCPEKKANCCSNRTCCPYGYACINSSKNGNVSSCKRMSMKEVIAKLFLH